MDINGRSKPATIPGSSTSMRPGDKSVPSMFMSRKGPSMGRSILDSDALASSDDEQDSQHGTASSAAQRPSHSTRRSSWLHDAHGRTHRQISYSGVDQIPHSSSNRTPTPTESNPWSSGGPTSTRGHSSNSSLPWGSAIWNSDGQKAANARLNEVLPSPTSVAQTSFTNESQRTPPLRRGSSSEASIPFAIPLQPTLKAYRSQSYSVGQLDQETAHNAPRTNAPPYTQNSRTRAGSSYGGLQHRPSRPSMFGDFSPDTSVLGQLREVDDDDEISTTSSEAALRLPNLQNRTIEKLAMENAILRQQALLGQGASSNLPPTSVLHKGEPFSQEISKGKTSNEGAGEENEEVLSNSGDENRQYDYRRPFRSPGVSSDRQLESFKKGHWQSSLGFSVIAEPPQSRRHSFAEIPLRHPSVGLSADRKNSMSGEMPIPISLRENEALSPPAESSFFSPASVSRSGDVYRPSSSSSSQPSQPAKRFHHSNIHHPQQPQSLYLVTFKAARAEFYYVQEGTGLEVNAGDLVVVEADRGTDLGTVAHKDIDWASARQLKERYVAEHYNWLMMFSRQGQGGQTAGLGAVARSPAGDTSVPRINSTEPSTSFDALASDIKPKMIKRLAQSHEIHSLREKEGNEAKAKRMCQQKVAEHHLNMEILDAEFQMDWKKLTFYYFAESYVNFNPLVTDLFKIYKTRIWMSAINPASFASPLAGQNPPLISPTNLDRDRMPDPRGRAGGNAHATTGYHNVSRGTIGPVWSDMYNVGLASHNGAHAYGQVFQASPHPGRYPPQFGQAQEFARGPYPTARVGVSYGPFPYVADGSHGSHGSVYDVHELEDENANALYGNQLKTFQDLSLGT